MSKTHDALSANFTLARGAEVKLLTLVKCQVLRKARREYDSCSSDTCYRCCIALRPRGRVCDSVSINTIRIVRHNTEIPNEKAKKTKQTSKNQKKGNTRSKFRSTT